MINKSGRNSDESISIDTHLLGIYFGTPFKESDEYTNIDFSVDFST